MLVTLSGQRVKTPIYETIIAFFFNNLTLMIYHYRISPYTDNTISSRQVMGIKKNINEEVVFLSHTKFSKLTTQKLYDRQ